jgi:hypothetical protein
MCNDTRSISSAVISQALSPGISPEGIISRASMVSVRGAFSTRIEKWKSTLPH